MSDEVKDAPTGLALLMVPFEAHEIGKLPKPTKAQTDAVKANFKEGVRCDICGAWHHPKVVHLDYVGHAALTKRLLQVDPHWSWEPMALTPDCAPLIDEHGGMWIRLTVCGMTRIGYGHADGKTNGDALKEVIGDALRNAALRFGAALDLWHKGDLYNEDELKDMGVDTPPAPDAPRRTAVTPRTSVAAPPKTTTPPVDLRAIAFADDAIATIKTMKNDKQMVEYFVGQKAGLDRLAQAYPELWADVFCARLHRTSGETEIEHALAEQHMSLMQIDAKDERLRHKVMGVADARKLAINPFGGQ